MGADAFPRAWSAWTFDRNEYTSDDAIALPARLIGPDERKALWSTTARRLNEIRATATDRAPGVQPDAEAKDVVADDRDDLDTFIASVISWVEYFAAPSEDPEAKETFCVADALTRWGGTLLGVFLGQLADVLEQVGHRLQGSRPRHSDFAQLVYNAAALLGHTLVSRVADNWLSDRAIGSVRMAWRHSADSSSSQVVTLVHHREDVSDLQVVDDGAVAASLGGGSQRDIAVWDLRRSLLIRTLVASSKPTAIGLSADGSRLAAGHADGSSRTTRQPSFSDPTCGAARL